MYCLGIVALELFLGMKPIIKLNINRYSFLFSWSENFYFRGDKNKFN